jgi:predicted secreted protein
MISKNTLFFVKIFCLTFMLLSCSSTPKNRIAEDENDIELLESDHITLQIGDTFTIKLSHNGSIGFSDCWINEGKCQSVKEQRLWYESSPKEKKGCIGCGGTIYWTFKAVTKGTDTIKIKNCPTGRRQKSCTAFQEDSLAYKEDLKYAPRKYDKAIVVRVIH